MNTIIKGFILINLITDISGFTHSYMLPKKSSVVQMNMNNNRRDFITNVGKATSIAPLLLSLKKSNALEEESPELWTQHRGTFGDEFLKDMTTLESGLLFKDVKLGEGEMPKIGDEATIQMVGYIYENGEKWTNTYKGIPTSESVVRVGCRPNQKYMKGLNEGLVNMKKGGKRILVIPAYLAYNYLTIFSEHDPNVEIIPGGSSLVCYVELTDFRTPKN